MTLEITESRMGRILVEDGEAGHRFEFRVATERGRQVLTAMAPVWGGGEEPPSSKLLSLQARELAEREAADQGWIEAPDPEVG
jgi:hypothetical protein